MPGRRARRLTEDERQLVHRLADTSRWFGPDPGGWPTSVPAEVAQRLAEKAYRRGVTQGAYFMLWHIHGSKDPGPRARGVKYAERLWRWRIRGVCQSWANGELPPGHVERLRGGTP